MVRIFVSTSHICTLYMILYARQTNNGKYKDVLLLDTPAKKAALKKVIIDTKKIYDWDGIIDLSPTLSDDIDFEVSHRKTLTRKLKNNFFLKPIYDLLLKLYVAKKEIRTKKIITEKLVNKGEVVEINLLTQTLVNDSLLKLYSKASVNYFEHGMGDYLFVQSLKPQNFYCVFADSFVTYLKKNNLPSKYVQAINTDSFGTLAQEIINKDERQELIKCELQIDGNLVLILLESVQMYQVPDTFYTDYLALCISKIKNPNEHTFVLKPHPFQTKQSIEISKRYMQQRKFKTVILDSISASNYSAEVLYSVWQEQTHYVFSVFSSALYYISKLYNNEHTKYYYAYDFFEKYTTNAPKQYTIFFNGLESVIKNVVSENSIDIYKK